MKGSGNWPDILPTPAEQAAQDYFAKKVEREEQRRLAEKTKVEEKAKAMAKVEPGVKS